MGNIETPNSIIVDRDAAQQACCQGSAEEKVTV